MKKIRPNPGKVFVAWNEATLRFKKVRSATQADLDRPLVYEMTQMDFDLHRKAVKA